MLAHFFAMAGIERPSYLDVGAHHAAFLSNTYYFYRKGSRGVLVEPDPRLSAALKKARPRDTVEALGVGDGRAKSATLHLMSTPALNTLSASEAKGYEKGRRHLGEQSIRDRVEVPLMSLNELMQKHFSDGVDLLSIDIEGFDLQALSAMDFKRHRPGIVVAETLRYDKSGHLGKLKDFGRLFKRAGYDAMADTFHNTLFVRRGLIAGAGKK